MEINQASEKFRGDEIAPMHTAEHILNGTMVKMFGCRRAQSSHIERKKSKCDYDLPQQLTPEEVQAVENKVKIMYTVYVFQFGFESLELAFCVGDFN